MDLAAVGAQATSDRKCEFAQSRGATPRLFGLRMTRPDVMHIEAAAALIAIPVLAGQSLVRSDRVSCAAEPAEG
jgi:hypothetical protein